jgi:hypothetical protein
MSDFSSPSLALHQRLVAILRGSQLVLSAIGNAPQKIIDISDPKWTHTNWYTQVSAGNVPEIVLNPSHGQWNFAINSVQAGIEVDYAIWITTDQQNYVQLPQLLDAIFFTMASQPVNLGLAWPPDINAGLVVQKCSAGRYTPEYFNQKGLGRDALRWTCISSMSFDLGINRAYMQQLVTQTIQTVGD